MKRVISIILSLIAAVSISGCSAKTEYKSKVKASINVGDYVQFGVYDGKLILWRCVDIDEKNGPLMLSDKILCMKPWDAAGTDKSGSHDKGSSSGSTRKQKGSNYWTDSNIRCWLNSDAEEGKVEWSCKNPPVDKNVTYNEYDKEAGFLSGFSKSDLGYMKKVKQKVIIDGYEKSTNGSIANNAYKYNNTIDAVMSNYEDALSEEAEDRVFLLDVKQLTTVYKNKEKLGEYYYVGFPTAEAVKNSEYKDEELTAEKRWYYWLKTPNATDASSVFVKVMAPNGKDTGSLEAYDGRIGVRPAFYLDTEKLRYSSGSGTNIDPYRLQKLTVE